jgi:sodium-independent sulfate anion transporter 11
MLDTIYESGNKEVFGYSINYTSNAQTLRFTGNTTQGLPEFKPPPFEFYDSTEEQTVTFTEMCSNLGAGLIIVPLVAMLEDIAICKAFCK